MDEIQKGEARNYLTAAGLVVIAFQMIAWVATLNIYFPTYAEKLMVSEFITAIVAVMITIIGVSLLILRKRDLTAITYLAFAAMFTFWSLDEWCSGYVDLIFGAFFLIIALIILTAKDKKKYLLFIIPALFGIKEIIYGICKLFKLSFDLCDWMYPVMIFICIYLAIAVCSERIHLPFGRLLASDVVTDFKVSGAVLGYLVFAIPVTYFGVYYLTGLDMVNISSIGCVSGGILVVLGILMLAIAKMRFTPVMFMLMGFMMLLMPYIQFKMTWIAGLGFILIALFAFLRTESRILPAIMLLVQGVVFVLMTFCSVPVLFAVLDFAAAVIAVYIAFAVFSQSKRLPLF